MSALRRFIAGAFVLGSVTVTGAQPAAAVIKPIQVGETSYISGDLQEMIIKYPKTFGPYGEYVKGAFKIAKHCGTHVFGFLGANKTAAVVAWAPATYKGCFDKDATATGGGPGAEPHPTYDPCVQRYRTPDAPDPRGISGGNAAAPQLVFIAATNPLACRDLTTQAPGGVWGTLRVAVQDLPAETVVSVKCQDATDEGVLDYVVATYAETLPASKDPLWIERDAINFGYVDATFRGVPTCDSSTR